jgi:hypothetical protein
VRDYRHFLTIGVLLLCLLAIGIVASIKGVPEAGKIIVGALAGYALLIKAWVEKARGQKDSWFKALLAELKAIVHARIERDRDRRDIREGGDEETKQV